MDFATRQKKFWKQVKKERMLLVFLSIPLAFLILFHYVPIYGVLIAFKNYRYIDGIIASPWNDFAHFKFMLKDRLFIRALRNTLTISLLRIFLTFPLPIIFALLLNEIYSKPIKRIVQTITYLPHFMSWIIIAALVNQVLDPKYGLLNAIRNHLGMESIYYQGRKNLFIPILLIAQLWQSVGWSAIIYLASMSSVDPELYESAELDGANRLSKALNITIPSITPVIIIQFILSFSSILNGGFDAVFNLSNNLVMETADIIDTYSYRAGLQEGRYSYTTAIGLFKNVIGAGMVLLVNAVARKTSDYALW